jgi:DNA ligase 1
MWSRSGRKIPEAWSDELPRMHLDGEVYAGRGQWETTVAAVARNKWSPKVCFIVFDAPQGQRLLAETDRRCGEKTEIRLCSCCAFPSRTDLVHVSLKFREVRHAGGEGLMLRRPDASYSTTRSDAVLEVKACPITGELRWAERRRVA